LKAKTDSVGTMQCSMASYHMLKCVITEDGEADTLPVIIGCTYKMVTITLRQLHTVGPLSPKSYLWQATTLMLIKAI